MQKVTKRSGAAPSLRGRRMPAHNSLAIGVAAFIYSLFFLAKRVYVRI